jgi:hypothetical protein
MCSRLQFLSTTTIEANMTKRAKKDRDGLHRRPNSSAGIYYFYFRGADGRLRERSTGTRIYSEARDLRAAKLEKIRKGEMPSEFRDWTLENVAMAVCLYWMWRKGWNYEQLTKFGSHAGQPGNRHGVQSNTE